eukprot:1325128-Prymnesium_polylepis.1
MMKAERRAFGVKRFLSAECDPVERSGAPAAARPRPPHCEPAGAGAAACTAGMQRAAVCAGPGRRWSVPAPPGPSLDFAGQRLDTMIADLIAQGAGLDHVRRLTLRGANPGSSRSLGLGGSLYRQGPGVLMNGS